MHKPIVYVHYCQYIFIFAYFPMQKVIKMEIINVYWGIRLRAFSGDILET
jgi:hypothetical protein